MGNIRQSSRFIKLCLEDSLFLLMEEKTFEEIKIGEICDKAGVGRTSFYRHYIDKEYLDVYR